MGRRQDVIDVARKGEAQVAQIAKGFRAFGHDVEALNCDRRT